MENNLKKLCEKAIDLGTTFHDEKIKDKILFAEIENRLGVVLPQDFAYIAKTVQFWNYIFTKKIYIKYITLTPIADKQVFLGEKLE